MLGFPIAIRSALDHLLFTERQRTSPQILKFDTTSMPVDLELPVSVREIKGITMLTVHVTDVEDGFGVSKRAVAKWRRLLELGKVQAELLAQLPDPKDLGGSSYLLALLERYSRAAYHRIASRRAGCVRNHPLRLRTSHGNGGNAGAGWALDVGHLEVLSGEIVMVGRMSITDAILEVIEAGGRCIVIPHRVWTRGRVADTSRQTWQRVVKPTVVELAANGHPVEIGYHTKAGSGLYIPNTWDEDAPYDEKGKLVA